MGLAVLDTEFADQKAEAALVLAADLVVEVLALAPGEVAEVAEAEAEEAEAGVEAVVEVGGAAEAEALVQFRSSKYHKVHRGLGYPRSQRGPETYQDHPKDILGTLQME